MQITRLPPGNMSQITQIINLSISALAHLHYEVGTDHTDEMSEVWHIISASRTRATDSTSTGSRRAVKHGGNERAWSLGMRAKNSVHGPQWPTMARDQKLLHAACASICTWSILVHWYALDLHLICTWSIRDHYAPCLRTGLDLHLVCTCSIGTIDLRTPDRYQIYACFLLLIYMWTPPSLHAIQPSTQTTRDLHTRLPSLVANQTAHTPHRSDLFLPLKHSIPAAARNFLEQQDIRNCRLFVRVLDGVFFFFFFF